MHRAAASILLLAGATLAQDSGASALDAQGTALERARKLEKDLVDLVARTSQAFVSIGGGSAVIVSPEGDVITNHHVAGERPVGKDWTVVRPGNVMEKAVVIGHDPRGDITLLKLQGAGPYPFVPMADSDQVQVGDAVLALGNPFAFSKDGTPHVTLGVVSAIHRNSQGGYSDSIQTDTAINPGNSGGPLLDMQGRLIGINGKIAMRYNVRASTGVGYAIPTNQIKAFIPQFRAKGVVRHGLIRGVGLESTPIGGDGAVVQQLQAASESAKRGLLQGDVIVEAAGRPVNGPLRFEGIVGTLPEGSELPIVVQRGGQRVPLTLVLEARPGEGQVVQRGGYLGIRMVQPKTGDGVEIEEVQPGSPALAADIQTGDVIKGITAGGRTVLVKNVNELVAVLQRQSVGGKVVLTVQRGEQSLDKEVTLGPWPAAQPGR